MRREGQTGKRLILSTSALALVVGGFGCATPQQQAAMSGGATIEPPSSGSSGPGSGASDETGEFVISRSKPAAGGTDDLPPLHLADDWWRFRAEFLRTNPAQVRDRDQGISDRQPPPVFCHGSARRGRSRRALDRAGLRLVVRPRPEEPAPRGGRGGGARAGDGDHPGLMGRFRSHSADHATSSGPGQPQNSQPFSSDH